ncbi:MAG: exodeoxyribonuclease V subunit gamma, partial [Spirochaetaceae bacterium]|nr:exodeoxyribonuclease V subunit gamma [Spirochaetaceae bacterium]
MAYHLITGNNLSLLIKEQAPLFKAAGLLGDEPYVICQNKQTAGFVQSQLAAGEGIVAAFNSNLLESALRELLNGFNIVKEKLNESSLVHTNEVKLLLYKYLDNILQNGDLPGELSEIKAYLPHLESGNDVKLMQFCDSLAGLFTSYGMNLPGLISRWQKNEAAANQQEALQSYLWRLLANNGHFLLSDMLALAINSAEGYGGPIKKVILVGGSFFGEQALRFFRRLSEDIQLYHLMVMPLKQQNEATFINLYGQSGYEFTNFINNFNLITNNYEQSYPSTNLGQLQAKIYEQDNKKIDLNKNDDSFTIFSTANKRREVELAKDLILKYLNNDDNLNLGEIALIAPNINDYVSHIEAVFGRNPYLNYNVADIAVTESYSEAFMALLNLAGSQFSRREIFALIDNPFFANAKHITAEDRAIWLKFCSHTAVAYGVTEQHRRQLQLSPTANGSWYYGLDSWLSSLLEGETLAGINNESEEQGESLGRLLKLILDLYHDFYPLKDKKLNFIEWCKYLESLMRKHLAGEEAAGWELKSVFRNLQRTYQTAGLAGLKTKGYKNDSFSFDVMLNYLSEVSALSEHRKGEVKNGINCASLLALRTIPFKVIIFMGLNNDFPANDRPSQFNLNQIVSASFDLSLQTTQRYAFLEAVMAAEEKLVLSYRDKDEGGEPLEPSPALNDLVSYGFGQEFTKLSCFSRLPLHSFDKRNFNSDNSYHSYDSEAFKLANTYNYGQPLPRSKYNLNNENQTASYSRLKSYFKEPKKHLLKLLGASSLSLVLEEEVESENFTNDNLIFELLNQLKEQLNEGWPIDFDNFFNLNLAKIEQQGGLSPSFYSGGYRQKLKEQLKPYIALANGLNLSGKAGRLNLESSLLKEQLQLTAYLAGNEQFLLAFNIGKNLLRTAMPCYMDMLFAAAEGVKLNGYLAAAVKDKEPALLKLAANFNAEEA